jgi:hypothetical protein
MNIEKLFKPFKLILSRIHKLKHWNTYIILEFVNVFRILKCQLFLYSYIIKYYNDQKYIK